MDFMNDPRHQAHYALAHQAIPSLIEEHGTGFMLRLMAEGAGPLVEGWRRVAVDRGFPADLREEDFSVVGPTQDEELCLVADGDRRWAVLFLMMPEVKAPLESEVGTFVWEINDGTLRYYTLEVGMSFDGSVGPGRILCEWRDGNHLNFGGVDVADFGQLRDAVLGAITS
ncbi:MAG: hypothetical protein ACKOD2_02605 [Ilumatobacteraceae bacterium]